MQSDEYDHDGDEMSKPGRSGSGGQALVEFALVFPIFALLMLGLVDIGRYVYVSNTVNEGAREGARVGSVSGFTQDCPGVTSRAQCIQQVAVGRMASLPSTTVLSTCVHSTGIGPESLPADNCGPGDTLTVTLSTPFSFFTPLIGSLIGSPTLTGQATITVNN